MPKIVEIKYLDLEKNKDYDSFQIENMESSHLYISITLTTPEHIREYNAKYRNIDKETDVLSFPMFEKEEIEFAKTLEFEEVLGDIIISIDRVKEQAVEYGHSFERELAYMTVHGFYHLMGEDHIKESDKIVMRQKEENVLSKLEIGRD